MKKHLQSSRTLAKPEQETEPKKTKRELPIWCRGIMGGCVNCGGCI